VTSTSNRENPKIVAYYQNQADILGIFWQFHKERLEAGNIEFAMVPKYEGGPAVSFNPALRAAQLVEPDGMEYDVLFDFTNAVYDTMAGSWQQFLANLGLYHTKELLADVKIPNRLQRFFTADITNLARRTEKQTVEYRTAANSESLSSIGNAGMNTGAMATVQLYALLREQFTPKPAIMMSKVSLNYLNPALSEIGIPDEAEDGTVLIEGTYTLLEDSALGIDRKRLRKFGLGFNLGCPASMNISDDAKSFLQRIDVNMGDTTMLDEFAAMVPLQMDRYVGVWYGGLTERVRQRLIDPENRRILSGELREKLFGIPRCPYGKER
jgi:hypothetical protein